jgi:murein DD-endopeptidase MepM/ murein hydrolase activator NlpD
VTRGETIARVGGSGWASAPVLHYQVRREEGGRAVPLDPRLFILDADWLSPRDARTPPTAPVDEDLPDLLR